MPSRVDDEAMPSNGSADFGDVPPADEFNSAPGQSDANSTLTAPADVSPASLSNSTPSDDPLAPSTAPPTSPSSSSIFSDKRISDFSFLDSLPNREPCPSCGRSRKFFCYQCHVAVDGVAGLLPRVRLPLRLEIIKHPKEVDGKSTAEHAAVLAPQDTIVRLYPDLPDYDPDRVVLVFPCDTALTLAELARRAGAAEDEETGAAAPPGPPPPKVRKAPPDFDTAVFIECTWNQTHSIFSDERLGKLRRIRLEDHETHFWRYQRGKPANFLSTIEAIYWFFVEFDRSFGAGRSTSSGSEASPTTSAAAYDDLLFFFAYMHSKIFSMRGGNLKVTEQRRERLAARQRAEAKAAVKDS